MPQESEEEEVVVAAVKIVVDKDASELEALEGAEFEALFGISKVSRDAFKGTDNLRAHHVGQMSRVDDDIWRLFAGEIQQLASVP